MELDNLKQQWTTRDAKLDQVLRINSDLMRTLTLGKVHARLWHMSLWLWCEVLLDVALLLALGSFAFEHRHDLQFLLPGLLLHLCVIILVVPGLRQLLGISRVDYSEPVVSIQKRLETLRRDRLRVIRYILVLSPLIWLPILIVCFKGLFNLNLYPVLSIKWVVANILFGLLWMVSWMLLTRRYSGTFQSQSFAQRVLRAIGGRNLSAATDALRSLERFEKESTE